MLLAMIVALGVALALGALVWRVRHREPVTAEARCRKDIQALKRSRHTAAVWSAGADSTNTHSRATKAGAWMSFGAVSASGGCGGCGGMA